MTNIRSFHVALFAAGAALGCSEPPGLNVPLIATGGTALQTTGGLIQGTGGLDQGTGGALSTGGVLGTGGVSSTASELPCDVAEVLSTQCSKCHGETTNWGGPMSLTQMSDFQAMGKLAASSSTPIHELVDTRINSASSPMPPLQEGVAPITAAEVAVLNNWLGAGMPAGTGTCTIAPPPTGGTITGTGGVEGGGDTQWEGSGTSWPGGVMPEETCYQFLKHGGQTSGDTSPHMTANGESYVTFFFDAPWTEPVVATRWNTIYDNTQVLHHWLLYKSGQSNRDGTYQEQPGLHPGAQLVAGWAVGGLSESFPPGVGLRMPPPGGKFELEWHLVNTSGTQVPDRSGIEVCVVPESKVDPRFVAGMTWLGTENLTLPAQAETKNGGICEPSFKNGDTINIVKWIPHMHLIGTHMDTWVLREDGTQDHVFSEPFQFDRQISYDQNPPVVVEQGDRLFAQCTFKNESSRTVQFGQSTEQEMCYQFAIAYPAGSLDGASFTFTGSDNTCLSLNTGKP